MLLKNILHKFNNCVTIIYMNIKEQIVKCINFDFSSLDINVENLIIESISADKGDYSLPCFAFAKLLKDSPMNIANQIKDSVKLGGLVDKCEVVAGYVNFFLNKEHISKEVLNNFDANSLKFQEGNGKVVCVDYGSPNLAKYLHIGHLKTLIVGESLCRLFEQFGYTVKRLNFIGDYGTPFGKIIGGLNRWGSLEDVEARGNDALQEYYVKFNAEEANNPELTQVARDIFKKIEDKDKEVYPTYQKVIEIGLKEANRMFKILGVEFDDSRGEMFYNDLVPNVIEQLKEKNLLIESEGAQVVKLEDFDLTDAVILKSDGTTIYITRDISAAIDRHKDYNFDKLIYVTDVAQKLHFKQLFKVVELMGNEFAQNMEHMPYGRFSLPDGKISSRRGKQAVLVDLMEYVQEKAKEVIKGRKFEIENPEDVVQKVVRAVLNYSVLKVERIKDCVFDPELAFSFEGETAPYMLYTFTRLESILRKYEEKDVEADYSCLNVEAFEIVKAINDFKTTLKISLEKRDTSLIGKRVMDLCKMFNKFYTTTKVLDGNENTTKAKIQLVKALKETLSVGFNLICVDTLKEM